MAVIDANETNLFGKISRLTGFLSWIHHEAFMVEDEEQAGRIGELSIKYLV